MHIFMKENNIIEKYNEYSEARLRLNLAIIHECSEKDRLNKIGKFLGIMKKGGMAFEYEDEVNALMDFAINDYRDEDGKNLAHIYKEKIGLENEIEKNLMEALLKSKSSLYKVIEISQDNNLVVLHNLLQPDVVRSLTDITFAKTTPIGMLIFCRLLELPEFYVTSGTSFFFNPGSESLLLREYSGLESRRDNNNDLTRFKDFLKLNRKFGVAKH